MIHIWRPGGNLPPVSIEYDLMRSRVEAEKIPTFGGVVKSLWFFGHIKIWGVCVFLLK